MNTLIELLQKYWIFLSMTMSLFWGIRSAFLYARRPHYGTLAEHFISENKYLGWGYFFMASYQFLFNFIGSMAGWFCFHMLLMRLRPQEGMLLVLSAADFFLFLFAVIGLTGHLPQTLYGFVVSVGNIGDALVKTAVRQISKE